MRGGISAEPALPAVTPELATKIIDSTGDIPNRVYRYPAARALLPLVKGMPWLTPNHVTYAHILIGIVAASLVAFTEARVWLLIAFVLCEIRMILDCFDGVLARARGTSSPFGRALDEIADSIAFITLVTAMTYRLDLGLRGLLVACFTLACGGLCANAWDFYKRKLTTTLRDGKDGVLDEMRHKKALIEGERPTFLAYWGVYFDAFQILLYEVRPKGENAVASIRRRAHGKALPRFAKFVSFISFDNGLGILHLGVLTGLFLESEVFALTYAIVMWLSVMIAARAVLGGRTAASEKTA